MILSIFLSCYMSFVFGYTAISLFWPKNEYDPYLKLVKIFSSICLGYGLLSSVFFIFVSIRDSNKFFNLFFTILFTVTLILTFTFLRNAKRNRFDCLRNVNLRLTKKEKLCVVLFSCTLITAMFVFISLSLKSPFGGWDAWAIWNMHARQIFRGGDYWYNSFTNIISWTHPDYPLLVPLNIAFGWKIAGYETLLMPFIIAFMFTFSIALLVFSSLAYLKNGIQGIMGGTIILGTRYFIRHGASQYSDVPLSFFILSSLIFLFCFEKSSGKNKGFLFLCGLSAGFASWTKNEGELFVLALLVSFIAINIFYSSFKESLKGSLFIISGLIIPLSILLIFKVNFAPSNSWVSGQHIDMTLSRIFDLSRYLIILREYFSTGINFTKGIISLPFVILLFALIGIDHNSMYKKGIKIGFSVLILMLMGYFGVYLTTEQPLEWHLSTSLNRLLLQLWPAFIFCCFMYLRSPGIILGISKDNTIRPPENNSRT